MSDGTTSPCPCAQCLRPRAVSNPPGLAQIAYRADDFAGLRQAMLRTRPGETAIGTWRPAPGDLGLQILEWWAYLGDILTFYNERIANESYLRTATQPGSVANLVALLGYEPAPGIAATGQVAATRSAAHPSEPLVIPAGMRLSSVATPGVAAQTFEVDAAASFTGPSSVPVTSAPQTDLAVDDAGNPQSVLISGQVSSVKAGDRLLLAGKRFAGNDDNWSLVTVDALGPAPDPGTGAVSTAIAFTASGWGPVPAPTAQGPAGTAPGASAQATDYRLMRPTAAAALWNNQAALSGGQVVITQSDTSLTVHLSAAVRAISPGDVILFDGGAQAPAALAVVAGVCDALWAVPYPVLPGVSLASPADIAVTHTELTLTLAPADAAVLLAAQEANTLGSVTVRYGFKDVGQVIAVPAPALTSLPATVAVPASYAPPDGGATAFLAGADGAGLLVTASPAGSGQVTLTGAGAPPATVTTPLAAPLRLLLDLVPVSRGTTVTSEVLGSGNAALINQSFTLSKAPLTYLAAGTGTAAALAVYVDGIQWQQVPSFYAQAASARVFVVSRSADQAVTTITFGDGIDGARLTSGTGNVVAVYRYGSGAASPPAGRLTTISQPQPNLASIQNPVAVSGGADPQTADDVRANAPASVFTFGRAVSAVDYEVVAAQAPGISRVAASWTFDGAEQRALVTVYVGDGAAAVAAASAALAGADDPNRPVSVRGATPVKLTLSCSLIVAAGQQVPAVVATATAAITDPQQGLFSPAGLGIGQRLYRSAIDAALMVPGVAAVRNLTVTRTALLLAAAEQSSAGQALDDFFDPGEGSFFDLPPGNVFIAGVSASD
jgi:predicted phage baseplate assembly protein